MQRAQQHHEGEVQVLDPSRVAVELPPAGWMGGVGGVRLTGCQGVEREIVSVYGSNGSSNATCRFLIRPGWPSNCRLE